MTVPEGGYFSIKGDIELIANGTHFWCEGHLSAVPVDDMSPDSRYCQSCYEVLKAEAEMLPNRRVVWMPKDMSHKTAPNATQTAPTRQEVVAKIKQHVNHLSPKNRELCNTIGADLEKRVKFTGRQGGGGQKRQFRGY